MTAKLGSVAVAVTDGVPLLEIAAPCEIFGIARPDLADPWYDFRVCAADPGRTRTRGGFVAATGHTLHDLTTADTVIVPPCDNLLDEPPAALIDAVRAAHHRGARIVSICTGAFVLAAAGLLDGRVATTHWMHADLLARRYPDVQVDASVLYIDHGDVLTSAGAAAGLDLCLHIIRSDLGSHIANALARRLVVPTHRPGGQAQYIETPLPDHHDAGLAPLLQWMLANLDQPLTVNTLARRMHLTERTLHRHFHAITGTTPLRWLLSQRIARARHLLESTDLPIDRIADASGLGSPANLRHHFTHAVGVPPGSYRRNFRAQRASQPHTM